MSGDPFGSKHAQAAVTAGSRDSDDMAAVARGNSLKARWSNIRDALANHPEFAAMFPTDAEVINHPFDRSSVRLLSALDNFDRFLQREQS